MPSIDIRRRDTIDVPACVELLEKVHQADKYPTRWPEDPPAWMIHPREVAAWVCEWNGAIIGHTAAQSAIGDPMAAGWSAALSAADEDLVILSRLFVGPDHRGRGAARSLIDACLLWSHDTHKNLVLDVAKEHHDSVGYYEGTGWTRVGEGSIPRADGTPLPVWLFVRADDLA